MLLGTCIVRGNTEPPVEKDQLLQMQKEIERSEYFISRQNNVGIYQSPNRKNGLSAAYTADEMSITPQDNQQHWSFNLALKGVSANGRSLYKPADQPLVSMHENTIQFNHNNQFTVEYVNNEQGIRQNFIIQQPGKNVHQLTVQLQPENGWQVSKHSATSLSFKKDEQLLSYNDLKVWDAKGKSLPAHFFVQNNQVEILVDAKDAVYPVTIDPIVANGNPLNASSIIPGNAANKQLGYSVSRGGHMNNDNYDDVIVGAPGYNANEGAVFVFYGSSKGLNPTTFTTLRANIAGARFGTFLSGGGDVNGDGYDDVVVGAPYIGGEFGTDPGAVYVFYSLENGGIDPTAPDIITEIQSGSLFGLTVAIAKDLNGDGYDDVIVGADNTRPPYNPGGFNAGMVSVFYGGTWGVLFGLVTDIYSPATSSIFGVKVAGAGDVNGDGYGDMMVGDGDSVYIYHGGPLGVDNPPSTILGNDQMYSDFGISMAGGGDIDNDGYDDIIIGARNYSDYSIPTNIHNEAGAIYVYRGSPSGITIPQDVIKYNQDNGHFGHKVEFAGDVNGDDHVDVVVSAVGQSHARITEPAEGKAFVYYGNGSGGLDHTPASIITSNKALSTIGAGVAGADVNGNGYSDIIVGAPDYTNRMSREGLLLIFYGSTSVLGFAETTATTALAENVTKETPSASVKAYPNPVVNNLSVQFEGFNAGSNTSIQLLDAKGTLVQTIQAGAVENGNQPIDVSRLTPGLYFVVIQNGDKVFREKIVKQ
jgi:hypothetical protein